MTQGGKQNETRNLQSKAFFRKLERLDLIEEAKEEVKVEPAES